MSAADYSIVWPGLIRFSAALISRMKSGYVIDTWGFRVFIKRVPRVRIHFHPPASLKCRETLRLSSENRQKCPQFRVFRAETRLGESVPLDSEVRLSGSLLWRADTQSGLMIPIRRMQCDHKPIIRRMRA